LGLEVALGSSDEWLPSVPIKEFTAMIHAQQAVEPDDEDESETVVYINGRNGAHIAIVLIGSDQDRLQMLLAQVLTDWGLAPMLRH
jgi:hypothetical protein